MKLHSRGSRRVCAKNKFAGFMYIQELSCKVQSIQDLPPRKLSGNQVTALQPTKTQQSSPSRMMVNFKPSNLHVQQWNQEVPVPHFHCLPSHFSAAPAKTVLGKTQLQELNFSVKFLEKSQNINQKCCKLKVNISLISKCWVSWFWRTSLCTDSIPQEQDITAIFW